MVSAFHFLAFVWILFASGERFVFAVAALFHDLLVSAFEVQLSSKTIVRLYWRVLSTALVPVLIFGGVLAGLLLAAQLATTQLGVSGEKLMPKLTKLNPLPKLKQMPRQKSSVVDTGVAAVAISRVHSIRDRQPQCHSTNTVADVFGAPGRRGGDALHSGLAVEICLGAAGFRPDRFFPSNAALHANLRMSKQDIRKKRRKPTVIRKSRPGCAASSATWRAGT